MARFSCGNGSCTFSLDGSRLLADVRRNLDAEPAFPACMFANPAPAFHAPRSPLRPHCDLSGRGRRAWWWMPRCGRMTETPGFTLLQQLFLGVFAGLLRSSSAATLVRRACVLDGGSMRLWGGSAVLRRVGAPFSWPGGLARGLACSHSAFAP